MAVIFKLPENAYPFHISTWASVPSRGTCSFDYRSFSTGWNFPVTVPEGSKFLVTDGYFQSKNIKRPNIESCQELRSCYAIFNSIFTLAEHVPTIHLQAPITLMPGFVISGTFTNQSFEDQNMIAALHGFVVPIP